MDLRIQKVQENMRANLPGRPSLSQYAESVNLSVWHLCRLFRSETGTSPIQYLKFLKMEKARELLQTSFLSVREIRRTVGPGDESHLSRDFKKAYGVTPTLYERLSATANVSNITSGIAPAAKIANKQQARPTIKG